MYILGIDSSTGQVSVAVNSDRQLLSKVEYGKNQKYMVSIISLIDKALKKASIGLDLVDLFAVNVGPGDFTGTRIGISVAKTLAWVGSKHIRGIGLLDVAALGIFFKNFKKIQKPLEEGKQIIIAPVLDVKRNEVYFSVYKVEENSLNIAGDGMGDSMCDDRKSQYGEDRHSEIKIQTVSNINIQNKNYYINKVSGNYLAESKEFVKKFSALFVSFNGFPSYILLGGSAFSSYKHLEAEVKELANGLNLKSFRILPGSNSGLHAGSPLSSLAGVKNNSCINIFLEKRVFFPSAFHLNLCAYCSYLKNRQENLRKVKSTEQDNLGSNEAQNSGVQNSSLLNSDANNLLANYGLADYELSNYRLAPLYVREFEPFKK